VHPQQPLGVEVVVLGFQSQHLLADITGQELLRQWGTVVGPPRLAADDRQLAVETLCAQRAAVDSPASDAPITATLFTVPPRRPRGW